jgi:hypothetical protein
MSKPIAYPMVCGITGEPITEWKDVTFITTYIKGVKETFPIHINKWALMDLHNASPTSKKSREASESEAPASEDVAVEEVAVSEDLETAPY